MHSTPSTLPWYGRRSSHSNAIMNFAPQLGNNYICACVHSLFLALLHELYPLRTRKSSAKPPPEWTTPSSSSRNDKKGKPSTRTKQRNKNRTSRSNYPQPYVCMHGDGNFSSCVELYCPFLRTIATASRCLPSQLGCCRRPEDGSSSEQLR